MTSPSLRDYGAVLRALASLEKPPLLIGRMAMVVYGSDQLTHDLDLVSPNFPEVVAVLYRHGFKVISGKVNNPDGSVSYEVFGTEVEGRYAVGLRRRRSFGTVNPGTGAELDIWLDPPVAYAELYRTAKEADLGGLKVLVPSKEHMIRLKEMARQDDPRRETRDSWDIQFLRGLIERSQ